MSARLDFMKAAAVVAVGVACAPDLNAQGLAQRVASAPEGPVQFSFAARPGVCGNGRTYYSVDGSMWVGNFSGSIENTTRNDPCQPGPVRVVLGRAGREVVDVNTFVGPAQPAQGAQQGAQGATDLGTVPAREAAEYLVGLARQVDGRPGRDAIVPAMLADSANITSELLAIARDQARARETRRTAVSWLGRSVGARGGPSGGELAKALGEIARDENDNQEVRRAALSVLSRMENGEGIPALIEISRASNDVWLGRTALGTLASSGDPRARAHLRTVVQRDDVADDIRAAAIKGIGGSYATSQDAEFLRNLYTKLPGEKTKEAVMSALGEMGGTQNARWLMQVARNADETIRTRRRAVQLSERAGTPVSELVSLYDAVDDQQMREQLISTLAQNGTKTATDKLLAIAKNDPNYTLRRRAVSALGRSEDPRVREALRDIVER